MSAPASFSRVAELKGENPLVVYIEGLPLDSGSYDLTVAATDFAETSYKVTFKLSELEKSLVEINPGSGAGVIKWLQAALDDESLVLKHVDGDRARSYFQATYTGIYRVPLRLPPNASDYLSHQQGPQAHLTAHALGSSLAHSFNQLCKQHAQDQSTIAALKEELQSERSDKAALMDELRIVAREKDLAGSTPAGKALHSRLAREPVLAAGPPVPPELLPPASTPSHTQTSSAFHAAPPAAADAADAAAGGTEAAAAGAGTADTADAAALPGSGADADGVGAGDGGGEMDEDARAAAEMVRERKALQAQHAAKRVQSKRPARTAGGGLKAPRHR